MKNKTVKTVCAMLPAMALLLAAMPVCGMQAGYLAASDAITVTGENAAANVGIIIMPYGYTVDVLSADLVNREDNILFKSVSADGSYRHTILLSEKITPGKYRVSENVGGRTADSVFFKPDLAALALSLPNVNAALGLSDFKQAADAALSAASPGVEDKLKSEVFERLYQVKPASGYAAQNFLDAFTLYEGLFSVKNGLLSLAGFFEEYAPYVDRGARETYSDMTQEQKSEAENCASGVSFAGRAAGGVLEEVMLVAKIHCAKNFSWLRDLAVSYCAENGIALSAYASLTSDYDKNNVFLTLFDERNRIHSASQLADKINALAKGGSGGGSSGGRGSSGGGVSGGSYQASATASPASQTDAPIFYDTGAHWARKDIEEMYGLGIVVGYEDGGFRPDHGVTRAEFVKILSGALLLEPGGTSAFEDVSDEDWYCGYVTRTVADGIVSGVSDTRFAPELPITREDAAVMVYRAAKGRISPSSPLNYYDGDAVSDYAVQGVSSLSSAGLLRGSDGYFKPKSAITRAEAASLLLRLRNLLSGGGQ